MKIILYTLFLSYIFLNRFAASAQSGYETGYIITNSGDTLYGELKDRKIGTFTTIYKKVRFKGNRKRLKKLSPSQIVQYKRGEDIYESVWLHTTSNFFKINYESIPGTGKKHFLKTIVKGNLTYYVWEQLDQESDIILEVPLFKRENENYLIRVTQGIFGLKKESLGKYFKDYPEVYRRIEAKQLKTPSEIALFYNNLVQNNTLGD